MLLSLTGASGAGKSMVLDAMVAAFDGQRVSCVEFDSVGVPPGAHTAWRHGVLERWVRRAVEEQREGRHFVLCGQVPVGELLAAPSADALDGIAACLLQARPRSGANDCWHVVRIQPRSTTISRSGSGSFATRSIPPTART